MTNLLDIDVRKSLAEELRAALLAMDCDLILPGKKLALGDGIEIVLTLDKGGSRRKLDPLSLQPETTWCFCDQDKHLGAMLAEPYALPHLSVRIEREKVLLYSRTCGPEPTVGHFEDMFEVAFALRSCPAVIVANLHGSGASVPQHFHVQLLPLSHPRLTEPVESTLARLLDNIRPGGVAACALGGRARIAEIAAPIWGIRIEFDDSLPPRLIGRALHAAVQREARERSQLYLSYNLYICTSNPAVVTVLFREVRKECPLRTPEVLDLVTRTAGAPAAESLANSDNGRWRWGWLECLGGLPVRDAAFDNTSLFNAAFWRGVYRAVAVDEVYRPAIFRQVRNGLCVE